MEKKIILFPGQGSLKCEILKEKYRESSTMKNTLEEISELSKRDLSAELMCDREQDITAKSYLIFAVSLSTFREYVEPMELQNAIFAGHSLGEITALTCAGALDVKDAVRLVKKRIDLASEIEDAGMYVVSNLDREVTSRICGDLRYEGNEIWISCDNTGTQTCIAGNLGCLETAAELFKKLGANVRKLESNLPYHCGMLSGQSVQLKIFVESLHIRPLKHIVLSNVFGTPYESERMIAENLALQLTETVRWRAIAEYLALQSFDEIYEMAFSDILTKMLSRTACSF